MDKKYPVTKEVIRSTSTEAERLPRQEELIETGQWYWIECTRDKYNDDFLNAVDEMLMCVVHLGSNYVKFKAPGGYSIRVHLDKFSAKCRREHNPEAYFHQKIESCRGKSKQLMLEVQEVTARLGVGQRVQIEAGKDEASTALVAVSGTENVAQYKNALEKAKKEELPALFKEIKETNELMATWMQAEVIPMQAKAGMLEEVVGKINDRIFHVEIYAGLTEEVKQVRDGEPAGLKEKLHVMQRRNYMDEECLANYRRGGMDFQDIGKFDEWLSEDENLNRILPFPRCMVAFKVRRNTKERPRKMDIFLKFWYEQYDKTTYMYVRNGDRLYRMKTGLDFGEKIFPDLKEFDPRELMVKASSDGRIEDFISIHDFEVRKTEEIEERKEYERIRQLHYEYTRKHKDEENPFDYLPKELQKYGVLHCWRSREFEFEKYEPFSPKSVYFDDMNKKLNDQLQEYNRISLVIQGLYDRSEVLHPHPPVQLWDGASFAQNIELVYDADRVLTSGEKPDIEAFIAKCNESFKTGCMTIGQELQWLRKEAEKEKERIRRSWRERLDRDFETFAPYGNPGPGYIAKIVNLTRTGKATFKWNRQRQTSGWARDGKWHRYGDPIPTQFICDVKDLFCVDGYKPGDFKQFFDDPRTRAEYLRWAPLLLAAEEYHAGNMGVIESLFTDVDNELED